MVTREDVKDYLNIDTNDWDKTIDVLISICEADYKRIRNKDWDRDDVGNVVYPENLIVVVSEMVAWKLFHSAPGSPLVSSSRIGDVTTSFQDEPLHYGWPRPITKQITRYLKGGQ